MPYYVVIPAAVILVAFLGGSFVARGIGPWYDALPKPPWTPPGAVFSFAWLTIYVLTCMAAIIAWQRVDDAPTLWAACLLLLANGALNAGWCYVFFAKRRVAAAVGVIVALEATILALIVLFLRAAPLSALLLIPYAAWTAFAALLNADIASRVRGRRNP